MHTAIFVLFMVGLALYTAGALLVRSYDREVTGFVLSWLAVVVFAFTGALSVCYITYRVMA